MPRLRSPQGSIVNVSDIDSERLVAEGFTPADGDKKATPKKASATKSDD